MGRLLRSPLKSARCATDIANRICLAILQSTEWHPFCAALERARFRLPQVSYDIYVIPDGVLTIVLIFGVLMPVYP